jgi:hypothetical protein
VTTLASGSAGAATYSSIVLGFAADATVVGAGAGTWVEADVDGSVDVRGIASFGLQY